MWTAAKRAASGLPTTRSALKFTAGMFGFSVLCSNLQSCSVPWAGDLKKKTWSSRLEKADHTRTREIHYRSDRETGYRYPVVMIRSKARRPDEEDTKPVSCFPLDADDTGLETATWDCFSVPKQ